MGVVGHVLLLRKQTEKGVPIRTRYYIADFLRRDRLLYSPIPDRLIYSCIVFAVRLSRVLALT